MCGIAGKLYFNEGQAVSQADLKNMTDALRHRGPDDEGFFVDGSIGLGHRRLSIIDLSPAGHQPMSDPEKKVWLVFNGEIYNFQELRRELERAGVKFSSKTDSEVIIHLYKKYGVACLKFLRGMFAFAIWDADKKELFLARDRVGKKPLKYLTDGKVFIFASELKAILASTEVKKEIDFDALDEYLTYQYVPAPKTGFKNIFKLEPAHYLIVKPDGTITKNNYWQIDYSEKADHSEAEWRRIVSEKLEESVRLRLVADVPLGLHLSGGIDSGLVTALAARNCSRPVKTFSIGFQEAAFNELPYARLVADRYKTDHQEFVVRPDALKILPLLAEQYEEPFADSSALPAWYLGQLTRQKVTVALVGDGGDENFAGYERYEAVKIYSLLKRLPFKQFLKNAGRAAYSATGVKFFRQLHRLLNSYDDNLADFYLRLVDCFGREEKDELCAALFKKNVPASRWRSFMLGIFDRTTKLGLLDKALFADINSNLPDDLMVKADIASMAHGLEVRSPFLDHELLELAAQIPANLKMRGFNKKYLLKKIAEEYLPKECIYRKKQGFAVPLEYWFKGELESYLKERLLGKKFLDYGFFERAGLENLINGHLERKENFSGRLWTLLMLDAWLEKYF